MKKAFIALSVIVLCVTTLQSCGDEDIFSFDDKVVHVAKAGGLAQALLFSNLAAIRELTISGEIDSRDFVTIRDRMTKLRTLNISNVTIAAYKGFEGSGGSNVYEYLANTIPIYAFYNPITATSLVTLSDIRFPESLQSVGASAFAGCTGLTALNLPNSLHKIELRAFARCTGLSGKLSIPAKVDTIGYSAFTFCSGFNALQLSDSLLFIGESAFNGCSGFQGTLNLPTKVNKIKDRAFQNCYGLSAINIPASVSDIGNYAFQDCGCPVNVVAENTSFSSIDGVLFDAGQITLKYFPSKKSGIYNIPTSVMIIDNAVFSNCKNLTSISIPTSVMAIGDYAFRDCSAISGTFIIPNSVFAIGIFAFEGCKNISNFSVAVDNSSFTSVNGVIYDITLTTLVQYPLAKGGNYDISNTTTTIAQGAFMGAESLNSINIPASVTGIGDRAFMNCTGLTTIRNFATSPVQFIDGLKITSWSVFDNINKSKCVLYVPVNTKSAYQNANQWKDFRNIIEM